MEDLYRLGVCALADGIASGEFTARAVVDAHIERHDAVNLRVNAITDLMAESARAEADRIDGISERGPLAGVPFTLKENIDLQGSPTTHGVVGLSHAMPDVDAPIVARLKAAGAIVLGRTNQSEMGLRVCADNPLRGRTQNIWRPSLTAGGSSAGDGVAVASGMTPFGIGNDMGGSLRNPAYCSGVAALKPTAGRVAQGSTLPPRDPGLSGQMMLSLGPMARHICDLERVFSVIAGRDIRDPRSVDVSLVGPEPENLRAALVMEIPGSDLPLETQNAIERAGHALEAAGWQVERATPPHLQRISEIWGQLLAQDLRSTVPMMKPLLSDDLIGHLERMTKWLGRHRMTPHRLHFERSRIQREWSVFFKYYPIVIGPTWCQLPFPIDADLDPDGGLHLLDDLTRFILPANALGLPALAMPTGVVDGLPTGIQLYADLWREDLLFRAGEVIERGVLAITPVDPQF